MRNRLRLDDILSRWGGNEFLAIISDIDGQTLCLLASDLGALVQQSSLIYEGHTIQVTVSIGATLAKPDDTVDTLVKRVDLLSYECKTNGRDWMTFG